MTLDMLEVLLLSIIANLQKLLEQGPSRSPFEWGRKACQLSRKGHVYVWRSNAPAEQVRALIDVVLAFAKALDGEPTTAVFRRNMLIRVQSLQNYLIKRLPIFPPVPYGEELELKRELDVQAEDLRLNPSASAQILAQEGILPSGHLQTVANRPH